MAICSISIHDTSEKKLVKAGVIEPVIKLLKSSGRKECAEIAAMILCNLTRHPSDQLLIVKKGGLSLFITLSNDDCYTNLASYACRTLANIASHRLNRISVVYNVTHCKPLSKCAQSATLAMYNISCASMNQLKMEVAKARARSIELASSLDTACK